MKKNLWIEESDKYTERAQDFLNDKLFGNKDQVIAAQKVSSIISSYVDDPKNILDIGCAYGGLIYELMKSYSSTNFDGIDPGKKSIEVASQNIQSDKAKFIEGCGDQLPFEDNKFDVVILTMVLQWVSRSDLIKTISEVDRVLKTGGVIFLEEYLPNQPVTSISRHSKDISIYKNNYSEFFTIFPWFNEIYREVFQIENGPDHQRNISVIRKYPLNEAYKSINGPSELHSNFYSDNKLQIFKNLFYDKS